MFVFSCLNCRCVAVSLPFHPHFCVPRFEVDVQSCVTNQQSLLLTSRHRCMAETVQAAVVRLRFRLLIKYLVATYIRCQTLVRCSSFLYVWSNASLQTSWAGNYCKSWVCVYKLALVRAALHWLLPASVCSFTQPCCAVWLKLKHIDENYVLLSSTF